MLRIKTERIGSCSAWKTENSELIGAFQYSKERILLVCFFFLPESVLTGQGAGVKLKEGRRRLGTGKKYFIMAGTGYAEKLRVPHPWKCSKSGWMGL